MKNVEKKRLMSRVFSLLMAGGMIAGSFASTWAATTHTSGTSGETVTDAQVALTKNFIVPHGVTLPAASFNFTYTKDGIANGSTAYNNAVTADSTQPDLSALDVTDGKDITYTAGGTSSGTVSGKDVYVKTISNIVPDAASFSHAGEYVYTISEASGTNSSIDAYLAYSKAEYKMHVFVKNKSGGGLTVAGVSVFQTKNDEGSTGTNAKVDLDKSTLLGKESVASYGNDFEFSNLYTPIESLRISKSVSGDYADMTKTFNMSITLTNPTTSSNTSYSAVVVDSTSKKPVSTELTSFTPGTAKSVALKTGQELVFVKSDTSLSTSTAISDADTKCMPAGLTYSVVETKSTDYSHTAVVTHGGTEDSQLTASSGTTFTVDTNTIVDTGVNGVAMSSVYHDVAVTGVIVRLLPALLMIMMVAVGIIIGFKTNRRA